MPRPVPPQNPLEDPRDPADCGGRSPSRPGARSRRPSRRRRARLRPARRAAPAGPWLVALVLGLVLGGGPGREAGGAPLAQCLEGSPRPVFAGHALPLDGGLGSGGSYAWQRAFPNLTFERPVALAAAPDGSDRLFVAEQTGRIRVFDDDPDAQAAPVFLDLSARVLYGGEMGLLGLAFPPDYGSSGVFYVNYTAGAGVCSAGLTRCTRIERYRVSADPDVADPASRQLLIEFEQPDTNHNAGTMVFGPQDGLLYIATGDGGGGGDPFDNAQNRTTLLGSILRIDPSRSQGGKAYAIPPGNPYAGNTQGFREEIWAYGLRNPWRIAFDRVTGDLWIGDVGQYLWEEIDFVPAQQVAAGGLNFGWPICEGAHDSRGSCAALQATPPIHEYVHQGTASASVTGGTVYRGPSLPGLIGTYVFADYYGETRGLSQGQVTTLADTPQGIAAFGEGNDGELYALRLGSGRVFRLVEVSPGAGGFPPTLSATGLFADTASLTPATGLIEYGVNAPLWSDGAEKRRFLALPGASRIGFDPTGAWSFPVGTALVKHFELDLAGGTTRRLETRVFVLQNAGWVGATYRWDESQLDASLVLAPAQQTFQVPGPNGPRSQTWTYPGPIDCLGCHTAAEGFVLGVRTRQLNRDQACESTAESQLDAWNALGLFTTDVGPASAHDAYPEPSDGSALLDARARAYLASNCAMCHQPAGPAPNDIDLRYDTPLDQARLVGVPASNGEFGLVDPRRVVPGDHARSVLWHRVQSGDPQARMPRGSAEPDPLATALLADWIDGLAPGGADTDADGVDDAADDCIRTPNPAQQDADGDGFGDACDCDFDNDRICIGVDGDRFVADWLDGADSGVGTDMDSDGDVDAADFALFSAQVATGEPGPSALRAQRDRDLDGVTDGGDVCIADADPAQIDTDNDGFGNRCDCDFDQDLDCDDADVSLWSADFLSGHGDSGRGTDLDGDGDVDVADGDRLSTLLARGAPGPSVPGGNAKPGERNRCGLGAEGALAAPAALWLAAFRRRRRARRAAAAPATPPSA